MGRYSYSTWEDDENPFPWWAKVLAVLAIACIGALVHRCQTGQW